jgi:hypothetical protein
LAFSGSNAPKTQTAWGRFEADTMTSLPSSSMWHHPPEFFGVQCTSPEVRLNTRTTHVKREGHASLALPVRASPDVGPKIMSCEGTMIGAPLTVTERCSWTSSEHGLPAGASSRKGHVNKHLVAIKSALNGTDQRVPACRLTFKVNRFRTPECKTVAA